MKHFLLYLSLIIISANAGGQSFSAPVGIAAVVSPGVFNMTPASICGAPYHEGAVWCTTTVDFTSSFVLKFQANFDHAVGIGADGIAVVFGQNITPISLNGNSAYLGYYNVEYTGGDPDFNQSFGVEFDIFDNSYNPYLDDIPGTDHTAICPNAIPTLSTPGGGPVAISPTTLNVKDGNFHNYRIEWCPADTTLKVYYDDTLRLSSAYNYAALFTTPADIHWGFTGGTGLDCSNQLIQDISLILPGPTTSSRDTALCSSAPITLYADTPGTYIWSTGATTSSIIVSASGTYWVHSTSSCAVSTDTIHVTLNPFTPVNLGNDTAICAGSTITLAPTLMGGSSVTWSTGATGSSITAGPGTYWITEVEGPCIATDTITIGSIPLPVVNLGPDTTVCGATVLTLQSSVTYGSPAYLWSNGSNLASITVTAAGTYWLQVTDDGCPGSDTIHVKFSPVPVVNLGNDTGFCVGNSLWLVSAQPDSDTYLWSTGSTADSINVAVSGTYWLQVSNGCTAADTITITVSPVPVVDLGPDTTQCQGLPVTLQSSVVYSSPVYLWSTGAVTPSIIAAVSGTYWLQVTNGGCPGSDTIHVNIVYDTLDFNNHDTAICRGAYVQVLAAGNAAITYQWLPTAGIPYSNTADPTIHPDTSAMYVMHASYTGCPDIVDSFYIDVQPYPDVYIGENRAVCQYDTLHFNAYITPGWYSHYSYAWSPSISLDNATMPYVVFTAGDSTELVLNVSTPAGCTGVDSVQIIVHPADFATISNDVSICPHDSVQLLVSNSVGYRWIPPLYLSDTTSASPWVHPITSQTYTVIATSEYGCLDTLGVSVTVYPAGVIYLGDSVTIYPGETYQITAQTNCTVFSWFPPAGLSSNTIADPVAMPGVSTKYIVSAATEQGCPATDSITIYVDPGTLLALPNAFSPGNGPNNILYILKRGEASLNYFRIFNRWGNKVYESANIDAGWDGTYNGTPQPYDVYVYELQAVTKSGQLFNQHGNITLIR